MRILDINNNELTNPDLTLGYLKEDKIFVEHHPAIAPVPEEWHYEVIAEYANGGKDIKKIIDVPYNPGAAAWDEYETVYRYIEGVEEDVSTEPSELEVLRARVEQLEQLLTAFNINATVEEV